ncbi:MAG: tetratricopeptide repeat protein [Rhodospirillales bacterium]
MELTIQQALQEAIHAQNQENYKKAEEFYRAILGSQPEHPEANHNLGLIAIATNNIDAALPLFKRALEANSKIEQFWISYIDILIKLKQFETAKGILAQARSSGLSRDLQKKLSKQLKIEIENPTPTHSEITHLLDCFQNGNYAEAEKLARSIIEGFESHVLSWTILGAILAQTDRLPEALSVQKKASQLAPKDAEINYNLGVTLKELGIFQEAELVLKKTIRLKTDFAEAHFVLGLIYKELNKLRDAEKAYNKAIELKPNYTDAHYNLGNLLQSLGRLEESELSYKQVIINKPDFTEGYNNLGNTLKEMGRLEEAEKNYQQAIKLRANYAEAHYNLGNVMIKLGKTEEAQNSYDKAIAIKPDLSNALVSRGQLLFDQKNFALALSDFDLSNSEDARARALWTLYAQGKTREIYERIESQLEIDAKNLRTAAFSAFLSQTEKKDTAHTFCNNPLDFLYYSNISKHHKNTKLFTEKLIKELLNIETTWEPVDQATFKGFQSKSTLNLFENPSRQVSHLKSIINNELKLYYAKFSDQTCSYIKNWPTEINLHGWYVVLKNLGYQKLHIHPDGWLSGVIYLKVVPSMEKDEGSIEFNLKGEYYDHKDALRVSYQPNLGDIVFFPSSLHHRTIPFTASTDRIIVSFDLIPN